MRSSTDQWLAPLIPRRRCDEFVNGRGIPSYGGAEVCALASHVRADKQRPGNNYASIDCRRAHDSRRADRVLRDCSRSKSAERQARAGPGGDLRVESLIASRRRPWTGVLRLNSSYRAAASTADFSDRGPRRSGYSPRCGQQASRERRRVVIWFERSGVHMLLPGYSFRPVLLYTP